MKKFSMLLVLIVSTLQLSIAQTDTTTFQGKIDYTIQNLDKNQIPTHILYDRVFPFARLDVFNQGESDTSSYGHFLQAVSELYNASYSTSNVVPPDAFRALVTQQNLAGKIPIGIIHYQFNVMDTLAIQNNLLQWQDNLLYDVQGRSSSPYQLRHTTVAAALTDRPVTAGNIVFTLPSSLILKNTSETVTNVQVTFGDGNPVATLSPGNSVIVDYSNPGDKVIRYVIHFSNSTQQTTYSYITVEPATGGSGNLLLPNGPSMNGIPCSINNIQADIAFQGYDETTATKGIGEVSTYYADCNNRGITQASYYSGWI